MCFASTHHLKTAERLREIFAPYRPLIVPDPIWDFSRLHRGAPLFCQVSPGSAEQVSGIVRLARDHGIALRTRGNGHALNGSSVPKAGELVIGTRELTRVSQPMDGTITAGAGTVLWSLDAQVKARRWSLPVMNDGYAGPSVGGFIAAGGFGPGSRIAGGFWNNVEEVTLVDGEGQIRKVSVDDSLFPWLFGSMGQLGVVVEAKLDVVALAAVPPVGDCGVPDQQIPRISLAAPDEAGRLFWFTLFVPESGLEQARAQLEALEPSHTGTFSFRNRYTYLLAHKRVVAPLVWPYPTSCYAVGSWGILNGVTASTIQRVLQFDADFMEIALANGFRRYVQSELPSGPAFYERYFGPEFYSRFRALKQAHDPGNLFNQGWVFE